MALQNVLGNIALDASVQQVKTAVENGNDTLAAIEALQNEIKILNDTLVTLFSAVLEKMPRVTATDQVAASVESGTLTTVSTVTTCNTLGNITQLGGQEALTTSRAMIMSGAEHIYSKISVS